MSNGRLKTASFGPGFLGVALLFCGFAVVAWILFHFAAPTQTYEEKRAQERRDKVAAINADAEKKLYSPVAWIDKTKGTVQLPIDVAMDLVVNDYQQKTVAPSAVKVEVPYPAGLMAPAAAPAPMAKASPTSPTSPPRPAQTTVTTAPVQAIPSPSPEKK
jgi:cytoskeletal protein RodZ